MRLIAVQSSTEVHRTSKGDWIWSSRPAQVSSTLTPPFRLSIAAKLAFPDGSMTVSGLRREAARGRLRMERRLMQRGVPIWEAAGFLGISPEVLQDTYGHHHPDYSTGGRSSHWSKGSLCFSG
jgi:hypothetical protein